MAKNSLSTPPSPNQLGKVERKRPLSGFPIPGYPSRPIFFFLSFLAFVVVRYIHLGARRDILGTIRFEFLVGIIVIAMATSELAKRQPNVGSSKYLLMSIVALFGCILIQVPFAADPAWAQHMFNDKVIKFAFLTYFMVVMIESPSRLFWFLAIFLFSCFYITLEAVEGLISGGLVWQSQGIQRLHGAVPLYRHPNSLAGVAMGTLPFVVFLFFHVRHRIFQLGLLATASASMVCVVYSGSRTAYLGLIGFVLFWWSQSQRKGRFLLYLLVVGSAFIAIVPQEYIERFESITGKEKAGNSKGSRILIMQDAITIFIENPLGVGVSSFPAVRIKRFGRFQDTHNLYLEVATNLGIQGFIVFLVLVATMLYEFRRERISFEKQDVLILRVAPLARSQPKVMKMLHEHHRDLGLLSSSAKAAGGFIIIRLVLGFFGMDLYEVYWWFGAGLALVLSGLVVRTERRTKALVNLVQEISESEN